MILMITPLIACRNHVVSAEQLKVSHQEDVVPIGNYIDENIQIKLEDGGAFSEKICVSADGEKIIGEIFFIPAPDGTVAVISNMLDMANENIDPIQGDLIYYVKSAQDAWIVFDPISDADDVPFITECEYTIEIEKPELDIFDQPLLCLHDSVTVEEISNWFSSNPSGEQLFEFRLIDGENYSNKESECF